jgi:hypothetical protein
MINIGNWNNLTPELITNYYLYGKPYTPPVGERIRTAEDKATTIELELDAVSYMEDGPGRYAYASNIALVQNFFTNSVCGSI